MWQQQGQVASYQVDFTEGGRFLFGVTTRGSIPTAWSTELNGELSAITVIETAKVTVEPAIRGAHKTI